MEQLIDILTRLLIAMILGLILGTERVFAGKTAGMRTYALVSMGSALFVITSVLMATVYLPLTSFDPLRVAAHVITGVGFLGAGLIIYKERVQGLTTAAGLWVAAGIGVASGFGLYALSVITTILTLFIFTVLWFLENKIKMISQSNDNNE